MLFSCVAVAGGLSLCAAPVVPLQLPFFTDFSQEGIAEKFTIIDANPGVDEALPFTWVIGTRTVDMTIREGHTEADIEREYEELTTFYPQWKDGVDNDLHLAAVYNGFRRTVSTRPNREGDDYLITPAFQGLKDVKYTLTFKAASPFNMSTSSVGCNLDVYIGNAPTAEAMTAGKKLASVYDIPDKVAQETDPTLGIYTYTFTPEENGVIYIGFHSVAAADKLFWINSIMLEAESSSYAPGEVTNLKAEAGNRGAHSATISFTVPTKNINGDDLSSITSVSVFRDDNKIAIKTFENPAKGEKLSFVDNFKGVASPVGNHTYMVQCYNESGNNEGVSTSVWVGEDFSAPVRNLAVEEQDDAYKLTWEKPVASLNGRYVDFDNLTYSVMASVAGSISTNPMNVGDTKNLEFMVPKSLFNGIPDQYVITMYVMSVSEAGGDYQKSMALIKTVAGEFYALPYEESFADGSVKTAPWTINDVAEDGQPFKSGVWSYSAEDKDTFTLLSQDEDGGYAVYHNTAYPKYMLRLMSPQINVGDAENPELTFYTGCVNVEESEDNFIQIELYSNNSYSPICEPILISGLGWEKQTVSLKNDLGLKSYRLAFKVSGRQNVMMLLDNIRVADATGGTGGIQSVDETAHDVAVAGGNGSVVIVGSCDYSVYDINGVCVAKGVATDGATVTVKAGVYVVKADATAFKCVVR